MKSLRDITRFFSSSPPVSLLGKRKVECWEDDDSSAKSYIDIDSSTSDDDGDAVRAPGGEYSPRPTKCTQMSPAVVTARNNSILRNTHAARQRAQAVTTGKMIERDIEDEQEQHSHLDVERKWITRPKFIKKGPVTFEQTAATSNAEPVKSPPRPSTPGLPTISAAQWSTQPNVRAREVLRDNDQNVAALLHDLQEPEYACHDAEIRDGFWQLMDQIEALANDYFDFELQGDAPFILHQVFDSLPKETVKIIGCVASGGPGGISGWEDLFSNRNKRKALVCAIIGNVLVEQVFQHLFFGGTRAQIAAVAAIQFDHRHADGFDRTALYASKIRSFLTTDNTTALHLPTCFTLHTTHITAALYTHLNPLQTLSPQPPSPLLHAALHTLTTHAAQLALTMRLNPHAAYHFTPAFKDDAFAAAEMHCVNHEEMVGTHPRGSGAGDLITPAEEARREGLEEGERVRMRGDRGLVQICLFPGVMVFRRGGWGEADAEKGVRCRVLSEKWVFCRWGRERVWGAGEADGEVVHGVAWKGGFVEFRDVVGGGDGGGEEAGEDVEQSV